MPSIGSQSPPGVFDVAIIGAGAAGLAAASKLHAAGRKIVVIEARDRIGGRIWTDLPLPDRNRFELGAEFIHGLPETTCQLLTEAGLETAEAADSRLLHERGTLRPLPDFWEIVERIHGQIVPEPEMTYEEFLARATGSEFEKKITRSLVEGMNAARAGIISARAIADADRAAESIEGHRLFRVCKGYGALAEWLASRIPAERLRLNTVVHQVKWRPSRVEIIGSSNNQRFKAEKLIVTVPIGVLKGGDIAFEPRLNDKEAALAHLHMGQVVKMGLCFRERFWAEHGRFEFALSNTVPVPTWWTQEPRTANTLTAWAGGTDAEKLAGLSTDELCSRAIASLSEIFSVSESDLRQLLVSVHWHHWSEDPFSRGAYSYPGIGGLEAAAVLAQPVENTLFFAGEATDTDGHWGTVEAALSSGERVAREILDGRTKRKRASAMKRSG